MSDDTTAALQALIEQVENLTTRMDGLHGHNARLLDQIKDEKRAMATTSQNSKDTAAPANSRPPGVYCVFTRLAQKPKAQLQQVSLRWPAITNVYTREKTSNP